jgi:spore germination protein
LLSGYFVCFCIFKKENKKVQGEANMLKIRWIAAHLFIFISLAGCAEPQILEEIGLLTTVGYDVGEKGKLKGTAVELKIEPNAKADIKIIETQAYSARGLKAAGNKKAAKRLLSGQMRVIVLGEELAKKGMLHIAETLTKDPSISDLTYLVIAEGDARTLLNTKLITTSDIGMYIFKLIDQNTKGELMPSATMQEVLHSYYTVGRDSFMPILKKQDDTYVVFSGVGIYKDDRLVGSISTDDSFYLKLINDKYKAGSTDLIFKSASPKLRGRGEENNLTVISLDTINSHSDLKLVNKRKLEFDVNIKLKARLLDINSNIDLSKPHNLKLFEKEVSNEMKRHVEKLISYCQSKNSDVIGLGEVYRSSVRNSKLTKDKWHTMYQDAKVNVHVDFSMMRSGINE